MGSFPVYAMRKHRISRPSAGRMKCYVVMVMLQEEGYLHVEAWCDGHCCLRMERGEDEGELGG